MRGADFLEVSWTWDASRGVFLVRGFDRGQVELPAADVRRKLFAWHEASYYGTLVPEVLVARKTVLALPAALAIDYFAQPTPLRHLQVNWPAAYAATAQRAAQLQQALAAGAIEPMLALEARDGFAWRVSASALVGAADGHEEPSVHAWLNAAMQELLAEPGAIRDAWQQLVLAKPMLAQGKRAHQPFAGDEDRWLATLGFRQDDFPYTLALRLMEPVVEGDGWRLQKITVDRATGELRLLDQLPAEWQSDIRDRLAKAEATWRHVWPAYTDEMDDALAWTFIESEAMRLRSAGVTVFMPAWWEQLLTKQPKLIADVRMQEASGLFGMQQLLDYDWRVAIGDTELTEAEFKEMVAGGKRLLKHNGHWIALDPKWLKALQRTMERHAKEGQQLALSDVLALHLAGGQEVEAPRGAEELEGAQALRMEVRLQKQLQQWTTEVVEQRAAEPFVVPPTFVGELRGYQADGAAWLGRLQSSGLGACLADDMGLGKTVQFIAHICAMQAAGRLTAPVLLICPTSVLGNWQQEWRRFAPSVRTHVHYGAERLRGDGFARAAEGVDVVITSYALALLDAAEFCSLTWATICLDEAQNIKNPAGKQSQAIRTFRANHRIALTGTPVENRLLELWSIFDFLNPRYLGSMRAFHRRFAKPIERDKSAEVTQQLQRLVRPFLLRRTKQDDSIQLALPDKMEQDIYVSLTADQAARYEQQLDRLMQGIDAVSAMERRGLILATLTKLKQICNHPALVEEGQESIQANDAYYQRSNKLWRLLEMVEEVRAEGERSLIFTQYVRMGRMIEAAVGRRNGARVAFLHGGLSKDARDDLVRRFQDREAADGLDVLILSLKAGGTGLNLTAATHVFHYDRWWNPAVENQATDRAYRIGQTRNVEVHKFISLGTLEERIQEMIEQKLALSEQLVGAGESWITEMSTDEICSLFQLRRDWLVEEEA
jgi:hypothetical protein